MPIVSNAATGNKSPITESETIFDGLEKAGEKLSHGCLAGSCGACRIFVTSGAENLVAPGTIEQNTIDSIIQNYKGVENLKMGTVRLACRAKTNGDIEFKPLR